MTVMSKMLINFQRKCRATFDGGDSWPTDAGPAIADNWFAGYGFAGNPVAGYGGAET
jgi:hypothetical protein